MILLYELSRIKKLKRKLTTKKSKERMKSFGRNILGVAPLLVGGGMLYYAKLKNNLGAIESDPDINPTVK
jgi:tRNA A37 N6-isopentenylltransferase MiaA